MVDFSKGPKAIRRVSSKMRLLRGNKSSSSSASSSTTDVRDDVKKNRDDLELKVAKTWEDDSSFSEEGIENPAAPDSVTTSDVSSLLQSEEETATATAAPTEEEIVARLEAIAAEKQKEAEDAIASARAAMSDVPAVRHECKRRASITEMIQRAEDGCMAQQEAEDKEDAKEGGEARDDLPKENPSVGALVATILVPASIIGAAILAYSIQNELLVLPEEIANLFSSSN